MDEKTTLHEAAAKGQIRACRKLCRDGAEVDELDNFGCTPLAAAMLTYSLIRAGGVDLPPEGLDRVEHRLAQTVRLLLAHGADIELVWQSPHGPFSPRVEAWVQTIDAQRRSDEELASLDQNTAKAIGKSRSSRF